jgi:hypothetical protein
MPASSLSSRGTSPLDLFYRRSRPVIGIELDGQQDGFVSSYTTLDKVQGEVTLTSEYDMSFDELAITFEGMKKTVLSHSVRAETNFMGKRHLPNGH